MASAWDWPFDTPPSLASPQCCSQLLLGLDVWGVPPKEDLEVVVAEAQKLRLHSQRRARVLALIDSRRSMLTGPVSPVRMSLFDEWSVMTFVALAALAMFLFSATWACVRGLQPHETSFFAVITCLLVVGVTVFRQNLT